MVTLLGCGGILNGGIAEDTGGKGLCTCAHRCYPATPQLWKGTEEWNGGAGII